jgi:hypothetical protein
VRLLDGAELGLLAAQTTFGLGDLHPLARAQPDQVGLELSDHRQDVEQQPPDRIGRVVHGGAERELHLAAGQLVGDGTRVRQRAGKPIELGHHRLVGGHTGIADHPDRRPASVVPPSVLRSNRRQRDQ